LGEYESRNKKKLEKVKALTF